MPFVSLNKVKSGYTVLAKPVAMCAAYETLQVKKVVMMGFKVGPHPFSVDVMVVVKRTQHWKIGALLLSFFFVAFGGFCYDPSFWFRKVNNS